MITWPLRGLCKIIAWYGRKPYLLNIFAHLSENRRKKAFLGIQNLQLNDSEEV